MVFMFIVSTQLNLRCFREKKFVIHGTSFGHPALGTGESKKPCTEFFPARRFFALSAPRGLLCSVEPKSHAVTKCWCPGTMANDGTLISTVSSIFSRRIHRETRSAGPLNCWQPLISRCRGNTISIRMEAGSTFRRRVRRLCLSKHVWSESGHFRHRRRWLTPRRSPTITVCTCAASGTCTASGSEAIGKVLKNHGRKRHCLPRDFDFAQS